MGLKTSPDGKVCCEFCATTLLVKTFRCPFRYCESVAMCPACSKKHPHLKTKAGHRHTGCEENAIKVKAQTRERQEIFNAGQFLLAASLKTGESLIHAIFRSGDARIGRFIPEALFCSADKTINPTLEDFERRGRMKLPEAPAEFDSPDSPAMLSVAIRFFNHRQEKFTPTAPLKSDQASLF